jgi:hypothetical protein
VAISKTRLQDNITQPKIFVYIEECDMAFLDNELFTNYLLELLENSHKANMQIIYSTSRAGGLAMPDKLLHDFERILLGATNYKVPLLGITEPNIVEQYNFIELPKSK